MTQNVQDYVLDYRDHNILYEIHLIDSPGFDDGSMNDSVVLARIASFINATYKLKQTLAGVIYLHDITKPKLGGVGLRNIRLLENMIGIDKWDNCTLVTTKWGCTTNSQGEQAREQKLRTDPKYFADMLNNSHSARMLRFDPKSKAKALEIIKSHLKKRFEPQIAYQMVAENGPKLALGQTDAGRVVADELEELKKANIEIEDMKEQTRILSEKFNEELFEKFKEKRDKLISQQHVHRAGRWAGRMTIVAGGIAAGVVTLGPGASLLGLEVPFEAYASRQKRHDEANMKSLENDFREKSSASTTSNVFNTAWLRDKKVKDMKDMDQYSLASKSSTDISQVEIETIDPKF